MILAALAALGGCQQPAAMLFAETDPSLAWPAPPAAPRIRWLGEIVSSDDLKPARSMLDGLGEALFGKAEAHSMLTPYAACVDDRDRLFVCDSNAQLIHVFDLNRRTYEQWRPDEDGEHAFAQPIGVAIDASGRLLVSDAVAGALFAFDSD